MERQFCHSYGIIRLFLKQALKKFLLASLTLISLTDCAMTKYLVQAGLGQSALIQKARPIHEVLKDEKVPPRIKHLLAEIQKVKTFGELGGLKPTRNYTEYVQLDRNAAIWMVSAAEPLRFKSKEYDFPIVGSFPYLGWFDFNEAEKFGSELKKKGWDVDVRGARAYSTLGWFRDAVLSSMISKGDEALGDLVNVILHESVHATYYLKAQSYFDESLANFIADRMTIEYFDKYYGTQSPEKAAYLKSESDGLRLKKAFYETHQKLADLYTKALSDTEKLKQKAEILRLLKETVMWKREINNATLIDYKTYHTGESEFETLFQSCGMQWPRFWMQVRKITEKSFHAPQQENWPYLLQPLLKDC